MLSLKRPLDEQFAPGEKIVVSLLPGQISRVIHLLRPACPVFAVIDHRFFHAVAYQGALVAASASRCAKPCLPCLTGPRDRARGSHRQKPSNLLLSSSL